MSNSIKNINELPSIDEVKRISQGLALIDAVIMPEWEYRYFSFNSNWDGHKKEMMASMRDGSGNEYFINFTASGVAGKVLFGEGLENASKCLSKVPDGFGEFKSEPAFSLNKVTFFFWRGKDESTWSTSPQALESCSLLGFLVHDIAGYHSWAESYYEKNIDYDVLKDVFMSLTINANQLAALNPDLTLDDLEEDLQEILN